jgi:hypothetical protein
MNSRKLYSVFLVLTGITLAFIGGYLAARSSVSDRKSRTNNFHQAFRTGSAGYVGQNDGHQVLADGAWKNAKLRLMKRWEASPAVWLDFELREETHRLLERVSNEDLEVWLRELQSDDDAKDSDRDIPLQMHDMVLQVLAPRAGASLVRSLAEHPVEGYEDDLDQAIDLWTKHDPSGVLALLDGNIPDSIKEGIDEYRDNALVELAGKDSIEFEARLAKLDQETRESVLNWYAWNGASNQRAAILARAARSPRSEAMALWKGLITGEGDDDLQLAEATLKELEISDAERAELDDKLVSSLLHGHLSGKEELAAVMQGWIERNSDRVVSRGILDSYDNWSQHQPDQVMAWMSRLPSGPHFEEFARILVGKWTELQEEDHPVVAGIAARISDPAIRLAAQKKLKESWRAKDAAAATEWEAGLPDEDQERLK